MSLLICVSCRCMARRAPGGPPEAEPGADAGPAARCARRLDTVRWKPPEVADKVDRRVVANPRQARELLTALSYVGGRDRDRGRRLVAMFACMYYAALRPAEAVNLRKADCELPETGWGRLYVARTTPEVGKRYTDSGELHDE